MKRKKRFVLVVRLEAWHNSNGAKNAAAWLREKLKREPWIKRVTVVPVREA